MSSELTSLITNYVSAARRVVYLELYQKDYGTGEDWHQTLTYVKREEKEALTALAKHMRVKPATLKGEGLNQIREDSGYALLQQLKHKYQNK